MQVKLQAIKKNKTIVEKVVDQIQTLIAADKLKPGDVLPVEYKLAKTFNIGKSSMREALKILEGKGVVEVIPRKGVVVCQQEETEDGISLTLQISPQYYLYTLEFFRVQIASFSVLACSKRTDSQIERFDDILLEIESTVDRMMTKKAIRRTFEKYGRLYVAFYSLLSECTGNPVCEKMLKELLASLLQQGPLAETILTGELGLVRPTFQLHAELIEMIKKQDPVQVHAIALKATERLSEIVSTVLSS